MFKRTRLAIRIGRRSLARHRGRSLAMIVLLTLPLCIAVAFSVALTSAQVPPERIPYLRTGHSQVMLTFGGADSAKPAAEGLEAQKQQLAAAGVSLDWLAAQMTVRLPATAGNKLVTGAFYGAQNWAIPEFDGRFDLVTGHLPAQGAAEVALSRAAMSALAVDIGGTINLDGTGQLTVVGQLIDPRDTERIWAIAGLEALLDAEGKRDSSQRAEAPASLNWYGTVELPRDVLVAGGWQITDRGQQSAYVQDPVLASIIPLVTPVLALTLAFAALLAGAGFALGAAELRTEIGALQAAGAGRRLIRSVLHAQGVICAGISLALSTVIGIGLAWLGLGPLSRAFAQIWAPVPQINILHLAAIWVFGLIVIVGSCRLATKSVAKLTIRQALHPDPPLDLMPKPSRLANTVAISCAIVLVVTLVLLAVSKAPSLILLAAVVAFSGIVALRRPTARVLGMVYRRLGLPGRIVARSTAFAPGRLSGQIAAVTAVVFISGLILTFYSGLTAKVTRTIMPRLPEGAAMLNSTATAPAALIAELRQHFGSAQPIQVDYATIPKIDGTTDGPVFLNTRVRQCQQQALACQDDPGIHDIQPIGMVSTEHLERIFGRPISGAERMAWDAGGVLVTSPDFLFDGRLAELDELRSRRPVNIDIATLPVVVVSGLALYSGAEMPNAFAKMSTSGPLVSSGQSMWYFPPQKADTPISDQAKAVADKMIFDMIGGGFVSVQRPPPAIEAMRIITIALTGVLIILVTLVSAITASMCMRDMAVEWAVLRRIGAPRAMIQRCAAILGLVPGLVASTLGIIATALIAPLAVRAFDAPIAMWAFGVFLGGIAIALGATMLATRLLSPKR